MNSWTVWTVDTGDGVKYLPVFNDQRRRFLSRPHLTDLLGVDLRKMPQFRECGMCGRASLLKTDAPEPVFGRGQSLAILAAEAVARVIIRPSPAWRKKLTGPVFSGVRELVLLLGSSPASMADMDIDAAISCSNQHGARVVGLLTQIVTRARSETPAGPAMSGRPPAPVQQTPAPSDRWIPVSALFGNWTEVLDKLAMLHGTANEIRGAEFRTSGGQLQMRADTVQGFIGKFPWGPDVDVQSLSEKAAALVGDASQEAASAPAEPEKPDTSAPGARAYMARFLEANKNNETARPSPVKPQASAKKAARPPRKPRTVSKASPQQASPSRTYASPVNTEPETARAEPAMVPEIVGDDDILGTRMPDTSLSAIHVPRTAFEVLTINGVSTAVLTWEGQHFASISGICAILGIANPADQKQRLEKDPRFVVQDILSHDSVGRPVVKSCIRAEHVGGWLYTISLDKVGEDARSRLLAYQAEITRAIDDYCRKGKAVNQRLPVQHDDMQTSLVPTTAAAPSSTCVSGSSDIARMAEAISGIQRSLESVLGRTSAAEQESCAAREAAWRAEEQKKILEAQLNEDAPLVDMAKSAIMDGAMLSSTQVASRVGLSPQAFHELLTGKGVLVRSSSVDRTYARYADYRLASRYAGYVPAIAERKEYPAYTGPDHTPVWRWHLRWTPSGANWAEQVCRRAMMPSVPGAPRHEACETEPATEEVR